MAARAACTVAVVPGAMVASHTSIPFCPHSHTSSPTDSPARHLQLYQQHVNPAVTKADLFDSNGKYIPRNKWNT